MSTLRSIVGSIRGMNKLFSSDNRITDRLIASEVRSTAYALIKQETNKRKLWQSPNLFTPIECIEMINVPLSECCNYTSPCEISRSKEQLPKIAEGLFGLLVQGVYNVNTRQRFDYLSPSRYENLLRLGLKGNQYVYWMKNNYLYINDPNVELATIYAFFEEDIPDSLNSCNPSSDPCISPLDKEFKFPGYLERTLKDIVYKSLSDTYFRHLQDYNPDGKDDAR